MDVIHHLFHAVANANGITHPETRFTGHLQTLVVRLTRQVLTQHVVQVRVQSTGPHLFRIQQFQGAGGRIPWVGKQRFFVLFPLAVNSVEILPG